MIASDLDLRSSKRPDPYCAILIGMASTDVDPFDLHRFVLAQNRSESYAYALREIQNGRKTSHWMWWIFPQLLGLGTSPTARDYAIVSLDEANAYVQHRVLGRRLREVTSAMNACEGRSAGSILGRDDVKFRSSMTLFSRTTPTDSIFVTALNRFFNGVADARTDLLLADR